jgi:hypothetical protein
MATIKGKSVIRDIGLVAGGVMVSNGITAYIPDFTPAMMIIVGLVLSYIAIRFEKELNIGL